MKGVLVKDMKMPENCFKCPMRIRETLFTDGREFVEVEFLCFADKKIRKVAISEASNGRYTDCPLVEVFGNDGKAEGEG